VAVADPERLGPTAAPAAAPPGMPPGPSLPRPLATAIFLAAPLPMLRALQRRHGDMFSVDIPVFGRSVIVASPALVKQVFQARPEALAFGETSPLGRVLGAGSLFAMDGDAHLQERRLILPAFHGERMRGYESIIEQEARRELERWPEGQEFPTMPSFMRITLNAILRTVFGAEGAAVRELAEVLPPFVTLGSRLALLPGLQRDLGPGSPGRRFRRLRARYDEIAGRLIDAHRADPALDARDDVASLLLRAHYEDGSAMSRSAIADELLTLLAAGHETTATSLAWAVDRLRRHPMVLRRLAAEAREGDERTLRLATIHEVQRTRPVIPATSRFTRVDFPLGGRVIPAGRQIVVSASLIHRDPRFFPAPQVFRPDRFVEQGPDTYTWIPFGGGTRRCPGAAFAHMEMDVVLRTLLRTFDLGTTDRPGERLRDRGIANAPARGGRAVVRRVTTAGG
jgi:cytochrome P450 family 138